MIRKSIARIPSKAEKVDRPVVQAAVSAFDHTFLDPDIALHGKYVRDRVPPVSEPYVLTISVRWRLICKRVDSGLLVGTSPPVPIS